RPGQRLYRTGDLGNWRADGAIEYRGRIDHQVKVRGFRIELGEIEKVLRAQPGVRDAVVTVHLDPSGSKRLIGYVVGGAEAALRAALAARLPEYMIPSALVFLDALPVTPNGKLDRKALPPPERPSSEESYVAPRDEREAALAQLFREVLGVPRV